MKNIPFKKIALILLIGLVIAQFFRIDKTNPPIQKEVDFLSMVNPPADIKAIVHNACYDCHSHESEYPWYTNVAPLSFWIKGHINHGREHLNFSEWGKYSAKDKAEKIKNCADWTEETRMPLFSYVVAHPEAKMSTEERQKLVDWFRTLK